jgi:hypothetical protein
MWRFVRNEVSALSLFAGRNDLTTSLIDTVHDIEQSAVSVGAHGAPVATRRLHYRHTCRSLQRKKGPAYTN